MATHLALVLAFARCKHIFRGNLAMARISQIERETGDKLANRYNLTGSAGSPSAPRSRYG
jgi:hypothetical protein